jgi:hypothetical protein
MSSGMGGTGRTATEHLVVLEESFGMSKHLGICALCLARNVELRDSHIIPKWVYKTLRVPGASKPDPYCITNGRAFQTSRQHKQPLLCGSCEQRFSVAERCVAPLTYKAASISILAKLVVNTNAWAGHTRCAKLVGYDADKIAYFGVSVIWRCAVSTNPSIHLGRYKNDLRRYLVGETTRPASSALIFSVRDPKASLTSLSWEPTTYRNNECHGHSFSACGLLFDLFVGKFIFQSARDLCLFAGQDKIVCMWPPGGHATERNMMRTVQRVKFGRQPIGNV